MGKTTTVRAATELCAQRAADTCQGQTGVIEGLSRDLLSTSGSEVGLEGVQQIGTRRVCNSAVHDSKGHEA